jgi:hypothetical protein
MLPSNSVLFSHFSVSKQYVSGLTTMGVFILGMLLLVDFAMGNTNIVATITGRAGRSLVDTLSSISPLQVRGPLLVLVADAVFNDFPGD